MERDYEKIEKLIKLRRDYAQRVTPVEQAIEKERKNFTEEEQEIMAAEWLSRRFDAGLFSLQVCSPEYPVAAVRTNSTQSLLMSFWPGWWPKMTGQERRLCPFWLIVTKICH